MIVSASKQVRGLAKAVAVAFASAGLTDAERSPQGGIAHTDLPWACPPLLTPLQLDGYLQDHFDVPLPIEARALHRFWVETMDQMWKQPGRLVRAGTLANLGTAMASVKTGQRAFRFSIPAGCPAAISEDAGLILSLEVAHAARISLPVADVTESATDYLVTTADGLEFGVKNGRPLIDTPWTMVSRDVPGLLESPRGETSYTCHHDQLASVRSIIHTCAHKFPHNFDALDQALQALRFLSLGGYCPELTHELIVQPMETLQMREKESAYFDAIDIIRSKVMSDRSKLYSLKDKLVPQAMTVSKFKREVFSAATFPFSMAPGKSDEIETNLVALYKNEIPTGLQRPL